MSNSAKRAAKRAAALAAAATSQQVTGEPTDAELAAAQVEGDTLRAAVADVKVADVKAADVKAADVKVETPFSIVTVFHTALETGRAALSHVAPKMDAAERETLAAWRLWFEMFKELFVTYLASLMPKAAEGERITISAESWKVLHDFCKLVGVGYAGTKGSKVMFPRTGDTLIPYSVAAAFYVWLTKCRTSQIQNIATGTYRMAYDGTLFFLVRASRTFDSVGEYKTALRMPEKVTEAGGSVPPSVPPPETNATENVKK